MAKKDNKQILATEPMRILASKVREYRQYAEQWKAQADKKADELKAEVGGEVNLTLLTERDEEVATIGETVTQSYDYKAFFDANPVAKRDLEENYAKEPTVSNPVRTKWVEHPAPPQPPAN